MAINFLTTTNTLPEIQINDTGNNPRLELQESGIVSGGISTTGGALVFEASSGIERARITSVGLFGIGTTSPGDKLTIEGAGAQVLSIYSTDTGSQSSAKTFINLYGENTAAEKKLQAQIASAPGHNASSAGELHFSTNNSSSVITRRMTIREDGNVGIGTASPGLKLDINSGTANSALRVLSTDRYTGIKFEDVSNNDTLFYDGQSDLMYLGSTNFRAVDLHAVGNLRVEGAIYDSNNSPGTANQVLVSTVTGTDWQDLSDISGVDGTGTANTVAMWSDADTITDAPITISGNNATFAGAVTISNAGNGNSPILSVTDTADTEVAWFTGNRTADTGAYISIRHLPSSAAESNRSGIKFQAKDDGDNTTTYAQITQYIDDYTGGTEDGALAFSTVQNATLTEVMRITEGNVGIGTTAPGAYLQIGDYPSNNIDITTYPDVPSEHMIHLTAPETTNRYGGGISFGENTFTAANITVQDAGGGGSLHMLFGTRHTSGIVEERMRITSAGNVGIGTTAPSTNLEVYVAGKFKVDVSAGSPIIDIVNNSAVSSTSGTATLKFTQGNTQTGGKIVSGRDGNYSSGATRTSNLQFYTSTNASDTEKMRITSTGKLGIGTTAPGSKLQVAGEIRAADGDKGTPSYTFTSDTNTGMFSDTADQLDFTAGGDNSLRVTTSGATVYGSALITSTVTATNFILSSDETLKDNIKEIDTKHVDVNWKNFELKSEPGIKRSGVIAQELEKKHPEFVRIDDEGLKSVAYIDLLISKIAELEARLEKLEK